MKRSYKCKRVLSPLQKRILRENRWKFLVYYDKWIYVNDYNCWHEMSSEKEACVTLIEVSNDKPEIAEEADQECIRVLEGLFPEIKKLSSNVYFLFYCSLLD